MRRSWFATLLKRSLQTYWSETPTAVRVVQEMRRLGGGHSNPKIDHIAFRSFDHRPLHDMILASCQYEMVENITLNRELNVSARWYRGFRGGDDLPRIFLSNYNLDNNPEVKTIIDRSGSQRSYEVYNQLCEHSQYAAWAWMFPTETINHVALLCNGPFGGLANVVKNCGQEMYTNQVSRDGLLLQSSTKADTVDGYRKAFVELVERKPVVKDFIGGNVIFRDGFEGENASNIFYSTAK